MTEHQLVLKFCHIELQFCLPKTSEVKPQDKNKLTTHFWIIMMIAILRNNLFNNLQPTMSYYNPHHDQNILC